jgi:phage/plasmid-associated DNA primase
MREDFWEFSPVAKLWLGTNHRPAIRGADYAIWRRIRLIPFTVTILPGKRDRHLPAKLRRELPGILAWAVRGGLAWQRDGLASPAEVTNATEDYRQTEDRLAVFIAEWCVTGPGKQASHADLYLAFRIWAEAAGEFVLSGKAFSESLAERGFERDRAGKDRSKIWRGIGLLEGWRTDADRSSGSPHRARTSEVNQNTGPHRSAEGTDHTCRCGASFSCPPTPGAGCMCPACGVPPVHGRQEASA